MNRTDTATRRVTTAIVLAVGLFAGGDSYAHIFNLARTHGQDVLSAALLRPARRDRAGQSQRSPRARLRSATGLTVRPAAAAGSPR